MRVYPIDWFKNTIPVFIFDFASHFFSCRYISQSIDIDNGFFYTFEIRAHSSPSIRLIGSFYLYFLYFKMRKKK